MGRKTQSVFERSFRTAGILVALLVLPVTPPPLRAEEQTELPPVVVSATKVEIPLSQAAASVTVIDRRQIEESHAPYVSDLLRRVPGLDLVQSGGPGQVTSVFLRGANSNQTLILIDGIRVNDPLNGGFNFSGLSTDNIERIEVIRGPQSPLYGSDAIGGVINIITRKGSRRPSVSVSIEGGSLQTNRESVSLLGASSRIDYSLAFGRFHTVGHSVADVRNPNGSGGLNSERDGTTNLTVSAKMGASILSDGRIEFSGRYGFEHSELDTSSFIPPFLEIDDPNFELKTRLLVIGTSISKPITSWWDQKLSLSMTDRLIHSNDPDPADSFLNSTFATQERRIEWQHDLAVGKTDILTIGGEYRGNIGKVIDRSTGSDRTVLRATLYNSAIYAQNQFRLLDAIELNAGGRIDFNNRFENAATYKIEVAYYIHETDTRFRAGHGTGFRAPTLVDLFYPASPPFFSNPSLNPEHSQSEEIGITQAFLDRRVIIDVAAYYQSVRDLIVFDFDTVSGTFFPMNKKRARSKGVEMDLRVKPIRMVTLRGRYTYSGTRDSGTGAMLLRRPRNKGGFTIDIRPTDQCLFSFEGDYVGSRPDFGFPTPVINERWVYRIVASHRLDERVELFGRLENLTDRRHQEINGFGAPRRMVFGGMTAVF